MTALTFPARARERARGLLDRDVVSRIWRHDATVWRLPDPHAASAADVIRNRLGWLALPETMSDRLDEVHGFAEHLRHEGLREAYLLGMGGSSLCAEVIRDVLGVRPGSLGVRVIDTTDPGAIGAVAEELAARHALFLVASKSGTTIEVAAAERFFAERLSAVEGTHAGLHLAAITDAGTPLQRLAAERAYRKIFLNPPNVGGRYSALSFFGLVPAALMGIDTRGLLAAAGDVAEACRRNHAQNPGLALGVFMAAAALEGRDKLTVLLPPSLASLGPWIEQLVAESTGKLETGILPIVDEDLDDLELFGADRQFVAIAAEASQTHIGSPFAIEESLVGAPERWRSRPAAPSPELVDELERRGHPVFHLTTNPDALGGEFFRWEFAVAVAAAMLGVNPFDEPNVREAKDRTSDLLREYTSPGRLMEDSGTVTGIEVVAMGAAVGSGDPESALRAMLQSTRPGDYLALLSFLPPASATDLVLWDVRRALRETFRVPVIVSIGPRYLHSIGQYYKGGPDRGVFVVLTSEDAADVPIPGLPYTFGTLKRAQAIGDFQALEARGRRVIRLHFGAELQHRELALRKIFDNALRERSL